MNIFSFMFSSLYDQASLGVMFIGLAINAIVDFLKMRSTQSGRRR